MTVGNGDAPYCAHARPLFCDTDARSGWQRCAKRVSKHGAVDVYPAAKYSKSGVSLARFFWLPRGSHVLRVAPLAWRGDKRHSLRVNSYAADGTRCYLQLRNLLGWTFLCPPRLAPRRWSDLWEFDHDAEDHGNARFGNLLCKPKSKRRVRSGAQGNAVNGQRAGLGEVAQGSGRLL